jgi:hypothetical protein
MRRRLTNLVTFFLLAAAAALLPLWARSYWTGMSVTVDRRGHNFQEIQLSRGCLVWRTPEFAPAAKTRVAYATWAGPADPVSERGPLLYRLPLTRAAYGMEPFTNLAVYRLVVPLAWVFALLLAIPAARLAAWMRRRRATRGFPLDTASRPA